jgi:hypothetical protein
MSNTVGEFAQAAVSQVGLDYRDHVTEALTETSWNRVVVWLQQLDLLRQTALSVPEVTRSKRTWAWR